jgi:hypothetical protein
MRYIQGRRAGNIGRQGRDSSRFQAFFFCGLCGVSKNFLMKKPFSKSGYVLECSSKHGI